MTEILAKKIRSGAETLRLMALKVPDSSPLGNLYATLADLIQARPLAKDFEFPLPETLPSSLHELVGAANSAFRVREPREMETKLAEIISLTDQPQNRKNALATALNVAAKNWRDANRELRDPACLQLALAPSLNLESPEKEFSLVNHHFLSEIPLSIANVGLLPAYDVRLTISVTSAAKGVKILPPNVAHSNIKLRPERAGHRLMTSIMRFIEKRLHLKMKVSKLASRPRISQFWIAKDLRPGHPVGVTLKILHTAAVSLTFTGNFTHYIPENTKGESNGLKLNLITPGPALESDLLNYFHPDLPLPLLTAEGKWNPLMKGERQRIVTEILADPFLDSGRMYVIRGVRRSGKTSLLQGLDAKLREGQFLPVYIDICSWYFALKERAETIDANGLLYELADSAVRDGKHLLPEDNARQVDGVLAAAQNMRLGSKAFGALMDDLSGGTKRRVVFLLDELDWWINKDPFKGDAQTILHQLATSSRAGKCTILLAHDWTTQGWDPESWDARFREDKEALPIPKRLRFLESDAFDSLIGMLPYPITDMAREYLWRSTGGWPGLTQFFCHEIVEALKRNRDATVVDVTLAKQTVAKALVSKDSRPFISTLMPSFSRAEIAFMSWLAGSGQIDPRSSMIRGLTYWPGRGFSIALNADVPDQDQNRLNEILKSLIEKQIIERREQNECALRVGAFSYSDVFSPQDPLEAAV